MTLLFAEGFETITDHTDMVARGLIQTSTITTPFGSNAIGVASRTGYPGKGLFLRSASGASGYSNSGVAPLGGANYSDFGMIPFNQSIYSLWQSGGFAVGFNGSFNVSNYLTVGAGESQQIVYDGAQFYWTIAYYNSGGWGWGLFYSTDLKNWQQPITQPTVNQNSLISIAGSGYGATVMISNCSNYAPQSIFYTTNMGMTWSTPTGTNGTWRGTVYTGNASVPWVGTYYNSPNAVPYYMSSLTGGPTQVTGVNILPSATYYGAFAKIAGPYVCCVAYSGGNSWYPTAGQTSGVGFALTSSDMTNAANWTVTAKLANQIVDIVYFNGLLIAGGYGGLYYLSPSNPSSWNNSPSFYSANSPQQSTAFTIFAMACSNNLCVAVGTDNINTTQGAIYTSTDGIHWTKQNRFILANSGNTNTIFNGFTSITWDGHQFVLCGGGFNSMVLTSPDGFAWECQFVGDTGEQTATASLSFLGVYSGTVNPVSNIFSPWNAAAVSTNWNGVGVSAAAAVGGQNPALNTRQVAIAANSGANTAQWLSTTTGANVTLPAPALQWLGKAPDSSCTNYYELVFTATANPNQFTVQWAVNGILQSWTSAAVQLAAATDTAGVSQLFFNLPRNGVFTVVDDIYLTNFAGPNNVGRIGPQNVFALMSTNAAQSQFSNTIGANSNPQTTGVELSNSEGYIYSGTQGAKDIYNTSNQVPSIFNVHAVQVDAFLGVQNPGLAVAGAVGIQQGTSSQLGTPAVPPAPNQALARVIAEVDPKTNTAFTNAGLNTLQMTVTKTT